MKNNIKVFITILSIFTALPLSPNLYAQDKFECELEACIKRALEVHYESHKTSKDIKNSEMKGEEKYPSEKRETAYRVKKLYYDLLLNKRLMKLADEIKSNFEKAVEKVEKKLESEDPSITQQDVLKLKLGLTGSKDNLNVLSYDRKEIIESFKYELSIPRNQEFSIKSKNLKKEKFELKKVEDYFDLSLRNKTFLGEDKIKLRISKVYIKINKEEEGVKIAGEARKISRGLLVTNLANFDFGIGEAKDLFEALFIYMRSVKNYLTKIHAYNTAIAELSYETGTELSDFEY